MTIKQMDITECSSLELLGWLRWNDPNGVWDPLDPEYTDLPLSELFDIAQRMMSGE